MAELVATVGQYLVIFCAIVFHGQNTGYSSLLRQLTLACVIALTALILLVITVKEIFDVQRKFGQWMKSNPKSRSVTMLSQPHPGHRKDYRNKIKQSAHMLNPPTLSYSTATPPASPDGKSPTSPATLVPATPSDIKANSSLLKIDIPKAEFRLSTFDPLIDPISATTLHHRNSVSAVNSPETPSSTSPSHQKQFNIPRSASPLTVTGLESPRKLTVTNPDSSLSANEPMDILLKMAKEADENSLKEPKRRSDSNAENAGATVTTRPAKDRSNRDQAASMYARFSKVDISHIIFESPSESLSTSSAQNPPGSFTGTNNPPMFDIGGEMSGPQNSDPSMARSGTSKTIYRMQNSHSGIPPGAGSGAGSSFNGNESGNRSGNNGVPLQNNRLSIVDGTINALELKEKASVIAQPSDKDGAKGRSRTNTGSFATDQGKVEENQKMTSNRTSDFERAEADFNRQDGNRKSKDKSKSTDKQKEKEVASINRKDLPVEMVSNMGADDSRRSILGTQSSPSGLKPQSDTNQLPPLSAVVQSPSNLASMSPKLTEDVPLEERRGKATTAEPRETAGNKRSSKIGDITSPNEDRRRATVANSNRPNQTDIITPPADGRRRSATADSKRVDKKPIESPKEERLKATAVESKMKPEPKRLSKNDVTSAFTERTESRSKVKEREERAASTSSPSSKETKNGVENAAIREDTKLARGQRNDTPDRTRERTEDIRGQDSRELREEGPRDDRGKEREGRLTEEERERRRKKKERRGDNAGAKSRSKSRDKGNKSGDELSNSVDERHGKDKDRSRSKERRSASKDREHRSRERDKERLISEDGIEKDRPRSSKSDTDRKKSRKSKRSSSGSPPDEADTRSQHDHPEDDAVPFPSMKNTSMENLEIEPKRLTVTVKSGYVQEVKQRYEDEVRSRSPSGSSPVVQRKVDSNLSPNASPNPIFGASNQSRMNRPLSTDLDDLLASGSSRDSSPMGTRKPSAASGASRPRTSSRLRGVREEAASNGEIEHAK
ncbi:hypothetical protein BKA69DRAFT_1038530 [Paraphysoderma sedebokerense]|nr:hypothetical protein BKA69DRAFT_1038530 [Paraphysoderma sedebokerense]